MLRSAVCVLCGVAALTSAAVMPPCSVVRTCPSGVVEDSIRGPWELAGQDSFFKIVPCGGTGSYTVVMLDSPAPGMAMGEEVGTLRPLVRSGEFDLELDEVPAHSGALKGRKRTRAFIASFSPGWRFMTLRGYDRHRTLSVDRLFPYLFRIGLGKGKPRPDGIDGAVNLSLGTENAEVIL